MTDSTDTPTAPRRRTITLTGRAPVSIIEYLWPVIASAFDHSYRGPWTPDAYRRAEEAGEIDEYYLHVRRHVADGRTIVYGRLRAGYASDQRDRRGGEILAAGADIAAVIAAIRRVAQACGIPARVAEECIEDLPPEDL
jgi:hypothetical protein